MASASAARNKKIATGVGGAALVAAIATTGVLTSGFGLWSDSADLNSATITSGALGVQTISSSATDISPDRADSPHGIDNLDTWRAVPGDVVEISNTLDVALEGDNLVAELDTSVLDSTIPAEAAEYVSYSVELRDLEGNAITQVDADGNYLLQAGAAGQDAGVDDADAYIIDSAAFDGTADVQVVLTVTFSADTPDQVLTESLLSDIAAEDAVTLTQVRDTAGFTD